MYFCSKLLASWVIYSLQVVVLVERLRERPRLDAGVSQQRERRGGLVVREDEHREPNGRKPISELRNLAASGQMAEITTGSPLVSF